MNLADEETWRRALLKTREGKDEYFQQSHDSPLHRGHGTAFHPLNYFEPDPSFRFEIPLKRFDSHDSVIMTTSKGTRQLFNKIGSFEFVIGDSPFTVQAYQSAEREDPSIFIPFRDATSGKETYGAARYLDLEVEHDDKYVLDFNYAYNPYCAYSDDYVCPLPPTENWLKVAIRAGERKYHD